MIPGTAEEPETRRTASSVLAIIDDSERKFSDWQSKCDRIDKLYSSLQSLSGSGLDARGMLIDREYNLFWASVEVIKPSIYSRPPVPVVATRFKDRTPLKRVTSELLERTAISGFDEVDINQIMLGVRDDLVITARGQIWLTYEKDDDGERVCIEHLNRRDFGHSIARSWPEVDMVWRKAWLDKEEARERFEPISGDLYLSANYSSSKSKEDESGGEAWGEIGEKAAFIEVWDKRYKHVYWVSDGCDDFLDEGEPHLELKGFFPCPRPAYGTLERMTLIPVPDISYIEDQLSTINMLTVRIHDLCSKLVVKGIIPSGSEVGDAVEKAMREADASYMLIPVPAMTMTDGAKVEWLPIDMVAQAILSAVEARRELIGNVQELFGIADIMRGDSEAQETARAQTLKAQFGSVRIRDRVNELIRIARDTVRLMVEIMAEEFDFETIMDMSQMDLPTEKEIKKQIKDIGAAAEKELTDLAAQAEEGLQSPQAQQVDPQQAQAQFKQAQQAIIAKYQPQIEKLSNAVTQDSVRELLRDQKIRPFAFDIETDSTIYPDEQAEKVARNEFMTAFLGATQALAPLAMSGPAGAKLAGGMVKFQLGPYRAGRELDGLIDEWVDSLVQQVQSPQPNPEAIAAQAKAELDKGMLQLEGQKLQVDTQLRTKELELKERELGMKPQLEAAKEQIKAQANLQAKQLDADVAVTREQAQLEADTQTTIMGMDAEAKLEAQRAADAMAQKLIDDQFRRDELAVKTDLEIAKLNAQRENAQINAQAKANQPKGPAK